MAWIQVAYRYDGSFAGFLSCIFQAYLHREAPACFLTGEDERLTLWIERAVDTHQGEARRVYRWLGKVLGREGRRLLSLGFLSCMPQRELRLWEFLQMGCQRGPAAAGDLADPRVAALRRAVLQAQHEAHQFKGFVRFSQLEGTLVSEISPKNQVLPLLRPHFRSRYPGERLVIWDKVHRQALFSAPEGWAIVPLEEFRSGGAGEEEQAYRRLWRRFYEAVSIEGRDNPKCRMTHMPKRFWADLTELNGEGERPGLPEK